MKFSTKYIAACAALASMSLVACNDLDTEPNGYSNRVSTEQKQDAVEKNPDLASAGVVGISSTINQYSSVYTDNHCDYGWPSLMLFLDSNGPDLVGLNTGYNWYSGAGTFNMGSTNNYENNLAWYYCYKMIKSANDVISNIDSETTNPQLQLFASQGYANRAFAYFNLIQLFQYTYKGNESRPGVPILTPENAVEAATEGCPRGTVQDTYDQIMSDLNTAISMLESSGLGVDQIAAVGTRRFVSLGAAYALRARVNLVMNNWQAAASDAQQAIAKSGASPLSIQEASQPGFNDSDAHNWLWGIYIQEVDRVVTTGICNFGSHMGPFSYGYAQVGAWRMVNKALFNSIPDTDCRKGWFLDANKESKNLSAAQANYVGAYGVPAYGQVKFAPYQGTLNTSTNAVDFPLIRIEEMYYIQAEATGMAGDVASGKSILENFVKTYRNPAYQCVAANATELQDECWNQRRVEFYGEGMSYFDLLRLNKPLDRRGGGYPSEWVYNIPAPLKPLLIPNNEIEGNAAIGPEDNNETWSQPTPVDDL